jgi:hypothetical protein
MRPAAMFLADCSMAVNKQASKHGCSDRVTQLMQPHLHKVLILPHWQPIRQGRDVTTRLALCLTTCKEQGKAEAPPTVRHQSN